MLGYCMKTAERREVDAALALIDAGISLESHEVRNVRKLLFLATGRVKLHGRDLSRTYKALFSVHNTARKLDIACDRVYPNLLYAKDQLEALRALDARGLHRTALYFGRCSDCSGYLVRVAELLREALYE